MLTRPEMCTDHLSTLILRLSVRLALSSYRPGPGAHTPSWDETTALSEFEHVLAELGVDGGMEIAVSKENAGIGRALFEASETLSEPAC